jgi:hypothetical protein
MGASLKTWRGIWLEPGLGVFIGLDQAKFFPGDKFACGHPV